MFQHKSGEKMRILVALSLLVLLAGCAENTPPPPQTVAIPEAPPYPKVPAVLDETMPKPPVSGEPLIWQPGHWNWTGGGYDWSKGRWVLRAGHGTMWQDGYWDRQNGQWLWIPAHWV